MQSGMSRRKFQALGSSGEVRKFFLNSLKVSKNQGNFLTYSAASLQKLFFLKRIDIGLQKRYPTHSLISFLTLVTTCVILKIRTISACLVMF